MKAVQKREIRRKIELGEKTMAQIFAHKANPKEPDYAEVDRSWAGILAGYGELPRDMGGSPLIDQVERLLERDCETESQREFVRRCWRALDSERAAIHEEERDEQEAARNVQMRRR